MLSTITIISEKLTFDNIGYPIWWGEAPRIVSTFMESYDFAIEIINYFMQKDKIVCAICAAPTILGRLGYLKDKSYTCFTCMNEDFGGIYLDQPVVTDRNLITARSAAASIEFA